MFTRYLIPVLAALIMAPAATQAANMCPEAPATKWRAALKEEDLQKRVQTRYDNNWSSYIAHWERQVDTARDVFSRGKALVIRFGKKRVAIKNGSLEKYIEGMEQRIETSYCLADLHSTNDALARLDAESAEQKNKRLLAGEKIAELTGCPVCHSNKIVQRKKDVPHIAGQTLGYLANQLRAFQQKHVVSTQPFGSALRNDSDMKKQAELLTDDNKLSVAVYYASLECTGNAVDNTGNLTPPRHLTVCLSCHGDSSKKPSSVVPILSGQKKHYLLKQLKAFRMTKGDPRTFRFRNRRYHQFMSAIAGPLTNQEMENLTTWFSARSCKS